MDFIKEQRQNAEGTARSDFCLMSDFCFIKGGGNLQKESVIGTFCKILQRGNITFLLCVGVPGVPP